jgi:prophage regulatory protein
MPALLRMAEVTKLTGYSKASIHRLVKQGKFPKPVHLCDGRAAGWVASEVHKLIDAAIAKRDAKSRQAKAEKREAA